MKILFFSFQNTGLQVLPALIVRINQKKKTQNQKGWVRLPIAVYPLILDILFCPVFKVSCLFFCHFWSDVNLSGWNSHLMLPFGVIPWVPFCLYLVSSVSLLKSTLVGSRAHEARDSWFHGPSCPFSRLRCLLFPFLGFPPDSDLRFPASWYTW